MCMKPLSGANFRCRRQATTPLDGYQTTEVTVNKDTQTPGGTARFSLKAGAVKCYFLTAEHHSAFLGQIRGMVQGKNLRSCTMQSYSN